MEEKPRVGRIVHHQPHELHFKPRAASAAARALAKQKLSTGSSRMNQGPKLLRHVGGRACFSRG
jgi:hypothetical protein